MFWTWTSHGSGERECGCNGLKRTDALCWFFHWIVGQDFISSFGTVSYQHGYHLSKNSPYPQKTLFFSMCLCVLRQSQYRIATHVCTAPRKHWGRVLCCAVDFTMILSGSEELLLESSHIVKKMLRCWSFWIPFADRCIEVLEAVGKYCDEMGADGAICREWMTQWSTASSIHPVNDFSSRSRGFSIWQWFLWFLWPKGGTSWSDEIGQTCAVFWGLAAILAFQKTKMDFQVFLMEIFSLLMVQLRSSHKKAHRRDRSWLKKGVSDAMRRISAQRFATSESSSTLRSQTQCCRPWALQM